MYGKQNIILIYCDARSAEHYTDILWCTVSRKLYWYTVMHGEQPFILIYCDARSAEHYTDILWCTVSRSKCVFWVSPQSFFNSSHSTKNTGRYNPHESHACEFPPEWIASVLLLMTFRPVFLWVPLRCCLPLAQWPEPRPQLWVTAHLQVRWCGEMYPRVIMPPGKGTMEILHFNSLIKRL
jgi:hypothetical protein